MRAKNTRLKNQTIDEMFESYSDELERKIGAFEMKFGYTPKDPQEDDYSLCSFEVQERSFQFFNDPYIQKIDTLCTLFFEI